MSRTTDGYKYKSYYLVKVTHGFWKVYDPSNTLINSRVHSLEAARAVVNMDLAIKSQAQAKPDEGPMVLRRLLM
jgi:hypothetical protein